ncbi:CRISPR/Cas system-associated endonuclease Cas1 [Neorhizobium huautlense]|uniref:CRISPR/Cas system-associated endonuclease Cas1 n=1 Tax=Neorhizobium huautlense TaxID=67774 RepID=A0ABT9PXI4_9HYPH|nr:CRISPR-associated endonuclease Cas1 [Neorhizobium huautlense]MDP9839191.1 CRISPR/Cas system-associated endonuclease Cas1 [Neorhizobium huautlense]
MKKLLNTLYVTTENASLRKDGENLVAEVEGVERARVPLHMLASVAVFRRNLCVSGADGRLRGGRHLHRAS